MNQKGKVQTGKIILDATAGYRRMWFNKKHPNCLYIDIRPECEPDEIQDFRDLPYPNESFNLIMFDPPFYIRRADQGMHNITRTFGALKAETWQSDLKQAFIELFRLLKPYGILLFKWQNYQIASSEILKLAPIKPLFYQVTANRYRSGSRKAQSSGTDKVQTLWFCFMKIPEENGGDG